MNAKMSVDGGQLVLYWFDPSASRPIVGGRGTSSLQPLVVNTKQTDAALMRAAGLWLALSEMRASGCPLRLGHSWFSGLD